MKCVWKTIKKTKRLEDVALKQDREEVGGIQRKKEESSHDIRVEKKKIGQK